MKRKRFESASFFYSIRQNRLQRISKTLCFGKDFRCAVLKENSALETTPVAP